MKKILLIVCISLPSLLSYSQKSACEEAVEAYRAGKYEEALYFYRMCFPELESGRMPDFYYQVALCFEKLEVLDSALFYAQKSIASGSKDTIHRAELAFLYFLNGRSKDGRALMKEISEKQTIPDYLLEAYFEMRMGKDIEEISYYIDYAIKNYPGDSYFLFCKASQLNGLKKCAEASQIAEKIIQQDSSYQRAYGVLGVSLYCLGKDSLAYNNLKIACSDSDVPLFFYLKSVLVFMGDSNLQEALADVNTALNLDYEEANLAYFLRGEIYTEMGEFNKAIADYYSDLEIDPKHFLAYYKLSKAYFLLNDKSSAALWINKYIKYTKDKKGANELKQKIDLLP